MKRPIFAALAVLVALVPTRAVAGQVSIAAPDGAWLTSITAQVSGSNGGTVWAQAECTDATRAVVFTQKQMIQRDGHVQFNLFPRDYAVTAYPADCVASVGSTQNDGSWRARTSDTFTVYPPGTGP